MKIHFSLFHPTHAVRPVAVMVCSLFVLAGCSTVPETDIKRPLTAHPLAPVVVADNSGAIFQPGANRARPGLSLFEDRRAKRVGDILTVNLVEKTTATRKSESTDERKANGSIDIPAPQILGKTSQTLGPTAWAPSASNKVELKDNETNTNAVTGSITVTVVEELANGNLAVAGEKQVRVNQDTEYLRLSGVVNPNHITASNSVNSTQMADVQLESTNSQRIDRSQMSSLMARFFLTILPF